MLLGGAGTYFAHTGCRHFTILQIDQALFPRLNFSVGENSFFFARLLFSYQVKNVFL